MGCLVVSVRAFLLACLVMVSLSGCLGDEPPEAQGSLVDTLVDDEVEDSKPAPKSDPAPAPTVEPAAPIVPTPVVAPEAPVVVRAPRTSFTLGELFLSEAAASGRDAQYGNPLDALANAPYRLSPGGSESAATEESAAAPPAPPAPPPPTALDLSAICPTDDLAVGAGGFYWTPTDAVFNPGSIFWIYEESNGMAGLQRNDSDFPTSCPTPDTIIF